MSRTCVHQSYCVATALRNSYQISGLSASFCKFRRASQATTAREWSSPELATIAENIRTKIIIPKRLNKAQQRLIFGSKNKERLENDPIYATIGDEEIRLQHIRITKDIPRTWNAFNNVILLSKDEQDYQNIIRILKDFKLANIVPKRGWLAKLARYMISKDMLPLLFQVLRGVEKTQMSLRDRELLNIVLLGIRKNAEGSGWDLAATQNSLRFAEEVIAMLENPLHGGSRILDANDPRISPEFFGFVVEMAGMMVKNFNEDAVQRETFIRYVERFLSMFEGHETYDQNLNARLKNHRTLLAFIKQWTPTHQALALAAKSEHIAPSHRSESQKRAKKLGTLILEAEGKFLEWLNKESPGTNVDLVEPMRSWRNRLH